MDIKRFFIKTKAKLVLLKFVLYKFLGNFIPHFKKKLMNIIKKDEITERIGLEIAEILESSISPVTIIKLRDPKNFIQGGVDRNQNFFKGDLHILKGVDLYYKLDKLDLNLVVKYFDGDIKYTYNDFEISKYKNAEQVSNILNDIKNKNRMSIYFKNIRLDNSGYVSVM